MALHFFAGCVGGCAGVVVGHPFDTIKVRLQTQDPVRPRYSGTFNCLRLTLREESLRGLYRGVTSPLAGVSVVNALVFGVQGNVRRVLKNPDTLTSHAVAGGVAGAVQSVVCAPVELAKTRLQLQHDSQVVYRGPGDCLRQIWASEGFRGVFRGFCPTLLREAPACSVYFASYEWMSRGDQPVSTWKLLLSGGIAGMLSWAVVYPVDVVKTRVQADSRYSSAWQCFRVSLSTEGASFMFRGLTSTLLRAFPTNAATFAVVTWVFRLLGESEVETEPQQAVTSMPIEERVGLLDLWKRLRSIRSGYVLLDCQCPPDLRLLHSLPCRLCAADT